MAMSDLNKLTLAILSEIVMENPSRHYYRYGDQALSRLLTMISTANVEGFTFKSNKRNLHSWVKDRTADKSIQRGKLTGFVQFVLQHSWRPNVRPHLKKLLELTTVQECAPDAIKVWRDAHKHTDNPYELLRIGAAQMSNHIYSIPMWHYQIDVDQYGNSTINIWCALDNLKNEKLACILPPLFTDSIQDASDIRPWSRSSGYKIKTYLDNWSGRAGAICHEFSTPLSKYEPAVFKWGYQTRGIYSPGEDDFRFAIANPTYIVSLTMKFHECWKVDGVRATMGDVSLMPQGFRWLMHSPPIGIEKVCFNLDRKSA